jgi:CHASE3 domain sensor protein
MDNSEWGIEGVKFTTDYEFSPQRNYKKGLAFTFIGSFFFVIMVVFLLVFSSLIGVVSEVISEVEELEENLHDCG